MAKGPNPETREQILSAAAAVMSRQGTGLSLNDVAAEAGLSRATLYRYFPRREDLLEATEKTITDQFVVDLEKTLHDVVSTSDRLDRVLAVLVESASRPQSRYLCELHPVLALKYLRDDFDRNAHLLHTALRPVYDEADAVRSGRVAEWAITRALLRSVEGYMLVRDAEPRTFLRDLHALFDLLSS